MPQALDEPDRLLFTELLLTPDRDELTGLLVCGRSSLRCLVAITIEQAPDGGMYFLPRLVQRAQQHGGIAHGIPQVLKRPLEAGQEVAYLFVVLQVITKMRLGK